MTVKMEAAMNVNGKEKEKWESSLMIELCFCVGCICVCA